MRDGLCLFDEAHLFFSLLRSAKNDKPPELRYIRSRIVFDVKSFTRFSERDRTALFVHPTNKQSFPFDAMIVGTEWLIEASGCDPEILRDEAVVREIFVRVINDLGLNSIGSVWHKFPGEGGVTGLVALTESHLACHTYPEHGTATFNLYCCRTRPEWTWEANLKKTLDAAEVRVTRIERGRDQTDAAGGGR